jgi:hypothetical protein
VGAYLIDEPDILALFGYTEQCEVKLGDCEIPRPFTKASTNNIT